MDALLKKRLKSGAQLFCELLVIWYGMGMPIPTNLVDTIKLIVSIIVVIYTGWKNHDFTPEGCEGTGWTRQQKLINKGVCVDIPAEAMEGLTALPDNEDGDE